jgi:adenine-specific DNA-methyltransferase
MNCLFSQMLDNVTCGDCTDVMSYMPSQSVDFILTDPPYITRYRDRKGRRVLGDDNSDWLQPAFRRMYRLLKNGSFCVSFYGWNRTDLFMTAWRSAGFRILGHIVFRKSYTSSTRFMQYRHEQAFLLGKGDVRHPVAPIRDVIDWTDYTGNRLHPTQKPLQILKPLIDSFTPPGGTVLDPFCGSGSTLAAARDLGRRFIGIELDPAHHQTARQRLGLVSGRLSAGD